MFMYAFRAGEVLVDGNLGKTRQAFDRCFHEGGIACLPLSVVDIEVRALRARIHRNITGDGSYRMTADVKGDAVRVAPGPDHLGKRVVGGPIEIV